MIYKFNPENYDMRTKAWLCIPNHEMKKMFGERFMDMGFYGESGRRYAIDKLNKDGWGASMDNFVPKRQEDATKQVDKEYMPGGYVVGTPDVSFGIKESRLDNIERNMVSVDDIRKIMRVEIAQRELKREAEAVLHGLLEDINKPKENKMEKPQTLRQKLRYAALSKDEKILRESGFYDSTGALTEQGRRIVVDTLWDTLGADDRKKVVEAVEATLPKEK